MIEKLPNGWATKELNDVILDIIDYRGKTPKKLGGHWSKSGIIALSAMNVKQGQLVKLDKAQYVSVELYRKWMKSEVRAGDILMTSEAPLGETYFVADGRKICLSQRLFCIRANPNVIQPRFLFYYFNSPFSRKQVELRATGTTVLGIRQPDLRETPITLPPLPTQRKIAAVLSAYDDLIENNTCRIKILEDMAAIIYRQWFVEFRFPGHENVPMVESALGLIPQGWAVGILGDLAESVRRNIKPSDMNQQTPYFGLEHLPRKSIALSNWNSVGSINSTKLGFRRGEILFGKIRPYFHKVGVAPLDGICSSDTIVIRPKRSEYFAITLSYVSSEHFIEYAAMTSQGTKMPRADWKVLENYPLVIPPDQIVQRFSGFVRDVIDKIQNLIFRNKNLRQTRNLLLPKLVSGEIDVSELDINTEGILPQANANSNPVSVDSTTAHS